MPREQELARLLERIAASDRAAYGLLFEREHLALGQFFVRLCRCPARAEDLVQNTFITIWRYRRNFAARGRATAYLYRVALNQWRQGCRLDSRRSEVLNEYGRRRSHIAEPAADHRAELRELREWVWQAIERLSVPQREVFLLHRCEGLSCPEIADVMDENVKTIESRLRLALEKLTRWLRVRAASSEREV